MFLCDERHDPCDEVSSLPRLGADVYRCRCVTHLWVYLLHL